MLAERDREWERLRRLARHALKLLHGRLEALCGPRGWQVCKGTCTVRISQRRSWTPSLAVVDPARADAPLLVAEIPDVRWHNVRTRRIDYESAGLPEIWVIDVFESCVRVSRRDGDHHLSSVYTGDQPICSTVFDEPICAATDLWTYIP